MRRRSLDAIGQGLIVIAILLAVIAAALWLRPDFASPATEATARAAFGAAQDEGPGIPDSGRQRMMTVEELKILNAEVKSLNERLGMVDKALRAGEYRVQTLEPRAKKEGDR
jgi:hypothetical protein